MSTIPIQTLIIDNDTNIGLTSDLINGTYKTLSLTDLSNNVYSRIFDLSSNLNSAINTKENILSFNGPLSKSSNTVSIDLSTYAIKNNVDSSLNSLNTNKQNVFTCITPLIKNDTSNNIRIDLSAYPLKSNVDSSLNSLNNNKQNNLTFSSPLTNTADTRSFNESSVTTLTNFYNQTQSDGRFLRLTGGTLTNNLNVDANITTQQLYVNNPNSTASIIFNPNPSIYSIFSRKVPWAMYFAEDYNASSPTILPNYLNDGTRNATLSGTTVTKSTASGNGALGAITFISGTTGSIITFPTGSIPNSFTILSLTRYTGATNNRRILQAATNNFLHGHWGGNRGVAHYDGWKTNNNSVGNLNDWLCTIGKNGGAVPNNILADGATRGTVPGGTGNLQLTINSGTYGSSESSDWALSCVMIWESHLTDAEMVDLNTIINNYKMMVFQ